MHGGGGGAGGEKKMQIRFYGQRSKLQDNSRNRQPRRGPRPAPPRSVRELLTAPQPPEIPPNSSSYCRSSTYAARTDGKFGGFRDQRQTPILIRFGNGRARREERIKGCKVCGRFIEREGRVLLKNCEICVAAQARK